MKQVSLFLIVAALMSVSILLVFSYAYPSTSIGQVVFLSTALGFLSTLAGRGLLERLRGSDSQNTSKDRKKPTED